MSKKCQLCGLINYDIEMCQRCYSPLDIKYITIPSQPSQSQPSPQLPLTPPTSLNFNLGSIQSHSGKLSFELVVQNCGTGYLQIYASDPSNSRKSGVLLRLNMGEYQKLKHILCQVHETIDKLTTSGQILSMTVVYKTDVSMELDFGSVISTCGELKFKFIVCDRCGYLRLYAADPTDMRISGVMLFADQSMYYSLLNIINAAEDLVNRLHSSNQLTSLF